MFANPVSAEKVAVKILAKQKEQGQNYLRNRDEDVKNSNVGNVGAKADETGNHEEDPFLNAINKLPEMLDQ